MVIAFVAVLVSKEDTITMLASLKATKGLRKRMDHTTMSGT